MIIKDFQLSIPIHITFTLYKYNIIDSRLISKILKECKNYSNEKNLYTIHVDDLIKIFKYSNRIKNERNDNNYDNPDFKPNSIFFIWKIINTLTNINWISFKISYEKEYTRLIKYENQQFINFYYKIETGYLDLSEMLSHEEIDFLNINLIKHDILSNNYLDRKSFFYIKTSDFLDFLESITLNNTSLFEKILNIIDTKIDEDDSTLLVKTDYTIF